MQGNGVHPCCPMGYNGVAAKAGDYDRAKRRKVRQGSLEDVLASQYLPSGPSSLHELLCFPEDMLARVFANDQFKSNVMRLLEGGMIETSDYSGVCAAREATRLLLQAIHAHTGQEILCRVRRMCDLDKTAQHVLLHISRTQDAGEACVFPDIRQQLHLAAQEFLESCAPPAGATVLERRQCYEQMSQWLDENGSWAVCQDRKSNSKQVAHVFSSCGKPLQLVVLAVLAASPAITFVSVCRITRRTAFNMAKAVWLMLGVKMARSWC